MFAAAHGADRVLSMLLSTDDIDVNKADSSGNTAFGSALLHGTTKTLALLLRDPRVDVNLGHPFHKICDSLSSSEHRSADLEKIKLVLTSRPEVDVNNRKAVPLWYELARGREDEVLQLVCSNPSFRPERPTRYVFDRARDIITNPSITGEAALEKAIVCVRKLDQSGCLSPNIRNCFLEAIWPCFHVLHGGQHIDSESATSFFPGFFISNTEDPSQMANQQAKVLDLRKSLFKIMSRNGITITVKDFTNRSLLHYAAASETTSFLASLLARGFDVNSQDDEGTAPLHMAACFGGSSAISTLLKAGAAVNMKTKRNQTPLHFAVYNTKYLGAVEELLVHGADVHMADDIGFTALHHLARAHAPKGEDSNASASKNSIRDRIDVLFAYGADAHAETTTGKTAIHIAAGNPDGGQALEQLISSGLDVHAIDNYGGTALKYSIDSTNVETMVMLLMHEVDMNAYGCGSTPLRYAIHKNREDHIALLLHAGADPDTQEPAGTTVRSYVESNPYWSSRIDLPERTGPPQPIDLQQVRRAMVQRLRLIIDDLPSEQVWRDIGFRLHKQLLAVGDWTSAVAAVTFSLTGKNEAGKIIFPYICTGCQNLPTPPFLYVCQTCEVVTFCQDCFTKPPNTVPWCSGHEFIKIDEKLRTLLDKAYDGEEKGPLIFLRKLMDKFRTET